MVLLAQLRLDRLDGPGDETGKTDRLAPQFNPSLRNVNHLAINRGDSGLRTALNSDYIYLIINQGSSCPIILNLD